MRPPQGSRSRRQRTAVSREYQENTLTSTDCLSISTDLWFCIYTAAHEKPLHFNGLGSVHAANCESRVRQQSTYYHRAALKKPSEKPYYRLSGHSSDKEPCSASDIALSFGCAIVFSPYFKLVQPCAHIILCSRVRYVKPHKPEILSRGV